MGVGIFEHFLAPGSGILVLKTVGPRTHLTVHGTRSYIFDIPTTNELIRSGAQNVQKT